MDKTKQKFTPEHIQQIANYILKNQETFFLKDNEADSWSDFIQWPDSKTDRKHLRMPNEPMIIDRDYKGEHMLCICTISEKRRVTSQIPVLEVKRLENWKAGYFLLPDLTFGKIKFQ